MPVNPATNQHFAGTPIPAVNQEPFSLLALSALSAGLGSYSQAKASQMENNIKLLSALGPTLIANNQISTQPGTPGQRSMVPNFPVYANGTAQSSIGDLLNKSPYELPSNLAEKWSTVQSARENAPLSDEEFYAQLEALMEANRASNGAVGGSIKGKMGTIKVGDTNPTQSPQFSFSQYDTKAAAAPFKPKGKTDGSTKTGGSTINISAKVKANVDAMYAKVGKAGIIKYMNEAAKRGNKPNPDTLAYVESLK